MAFVALFRECELLPPPKPPRAAIDALLERYLGPIDRTRKGLLPA